MTMTKREKTKFGKRLLKLADYLAKLPEEAWEYNTLGKKAECGTVGCAAGHACTMPEFKRLGAQLYKPGWAIGIDALDCRVVDGETVVASGWEGVGEVLFGLTFDESVELFANQDLLEAEEDGKPVRSAVIRNIREMAKVKYGVTA